jgi:hypothetical protein
MMPEQLIVIYPERGNAFYGQLARRVANACNGLASEVRLMSAAEFGDADKVGLRKVIALVICPAECALSGDRVLKGLNDTARIVAVAADSVKTPWYASQYSSLDRVDAFCDIGFIDQSRWNPIADVPYHFVFNAGLEEEIETLQTLTPTERPFAWALIAHITPDRARLGNDLITRLGTEGFLFLPSLRPVRPGEGMLSPNALRRLLRRTSCYVWRSHHTYPYYESFRFLDAILAGAVPCKIDSMAEATLLAIPNVYSSVDGLSEALENRTASSLFDESRSFYLDKGPLSGHFKEFLSHV